MRGARGEVRFDLRGGEARGVDDGAGREVGAVDAVGVEGGEAGAGGEAGEVGEGGEGVGGRDEGLVGLGVSWGVGLGGEGGGDGLWGWRGSWRVAGWW